jgi:AcrR family transcriptional regulator
VEEREEMTMSKVTASAAQEPTRLPPALGLRERKVQRTRARVIDTAVAMCLDVGYDKATVERISAEVDISPRTFSRYFASKDEAFLAVFEPMVDAVADELTKLPGPLAPLEALRLAHVAVFARIADRPLGTPSADQLAVMFRVVGSSKTLRAKAVEYRDDRVMTTLATSAGLPAGDQRVELAMTLFNLTVLTACVDAVVEAEPERVGPRALRERMQAALSDVAEAVAALDVDGRDA